MRYLVRRNEHLYFRMAVPTDLRVMLRMKEVKKSLKTCCLQSAKQLVKVYGFEAERLFILARTKMLSDEQIPWPLPSSKILFEPSFANISAALWGRVARLLAEHLGIFGVHPFPMSLLSVQYCIVDVLIGHE